MERARRIEKHGYSWLVAPSFEGVVATDARVVEESGHTSLIKAGPARRVWSFQPETEDFSGEVYVKKCLVPDLLDRIKYLFQSAKAMREWRRLKELSKRGVPVAEPLAVGVRRRGPFLVDSILITRGLRSAVPLRVYVNEHARLATHAEVVAFTKAFAGFLTRLHDAGALPKDFHADNVMVSDEGPAVGFDLIDVVDVTIGGRISRAHRLANLAVLGHFFCRVVPRHWRLRFLTSYLGGSAEGAGAARLVEQIAKRGMRKIWARRDSRVFGNNKHYVRVQAGRLSGHARRLREAEVALRAFEHGDPLEDACRIIKNSRSSKVGVLTVEVDGRQTRLLVKRRNGRLSWKSAFDVLRASRGKRGFRYGAAFQTRYLPTARVLATLDERCCGRLGASWLVTEYIDGAENLAVILAGRGSLRLVELLEGQRPLVAQRLARTLRRMHWCGFSMRDLKTANILLFEREGRLEFALTDLDDVRFYANGVGERRRIANLARLYFDVVWLKGAEREELLRFLRDYLGTPDRATLARYVSGVMQLVKAKRATFVPKGIFAEVRRPK